MEWRNVGVEALKYAFVGFSGFGVGAVFGDVSGNAPFNAGVVFAVSFMASKALRTFTRNLAIKYDMQLSNYHIVKKIADSSLKLVAAVSLFALGVISSTGLMVMSGVLLTFCALEIGLGICLKYTEEDDLLDDITIDKKTPWHVRHAYA